MKKTQTQNPKQPYRIRSPALRKSHLRSNAAASMGPTTPQLKWKFESPKGSAPEPDKVSARKLAANVWLVNGSFGFDQPNITDPHRPTQHAKARNYNKSPILKNYARNDIIHKLGNSVESATKWDLGKLLEDKQVDPTSDVSFLHSELEHACIRINELVIEHHSVKKKFDHVVRKLSYEKESWRRKEHEKIQAVIDSIKDDLHRERKNRHRIEIVNSKLVNELAEAKLSSKRFLQDYEKEKKIRELMEEVCDELAKEIGQDKAEIEALKAESIRIREEVEEERKMLQMAEVWREERVQMKLVDAKVTLEQKYLQLCMLRAKIEVFLSAPSDSNPNEYRRKVAESLREEVDSVKVKEIKEFSYEPPPKSEDTFSIFEELKSKEEANKNEREIGACYGYTSGSINDCSNKSKKEIDNIEDEESGWETVSHVEEQGSSNTIEGSEKSVNNAYEESNASVSDTDWEFNGDNEKANSEISEVCSVGTRQSRKKGSSIARFWKSSHKKNLENGPRNSFEITNGRMYNATLSPDGRLGDANLSSPSVRNWSSPESVKQIINRGAKGIIEWPRGMQKKNSKSKFLEAGVDNQKVQLRHALEQMI